MENPLGLRGAIQEIMTIQGLTTKGLLGKLPKDYYRRAKYVLIKDSSSFRTATFMAISEGLGVSAGDILQLADSIPGQEKYHQIISNVRLARIKDQFRGLPPAVQELAVIEIEEAILGPIQKLRT